MFLQGICFFIFFVEGLPKGWSLLKQNRVKKNTGTEIPDPLEAAETYQNRRSVKS